ncbi:hypothetical protein [Aeromicrobium sp. UC242_57]|uniref:hypothetical protein n=1 Tax=Aeromicrobium sp. UC242_57 TaxID=3374624 RepID=UPI0037B35103
MRKLFVALAAVLVSAALVATPLTAADAAKSKKYRISLKLSESSSTCRRRPSRCATPRSPGE